MADAVFLKVLSMSAAGSVAILAVTAARYLLKRLPKALSCALWLVVLIRLLCPVSIKAPFGIMPEIEVPAVRTAVSSMPADREGVSESEGEGAALSAAPERATERVSGTGGGSRRAKGSWKGVVFAVLKYVWLAGAAALIMGEAWSSRALRKGLRGARRVRENIYEADNVGVPFTLGILRPKIYLPGRLGERERTWVVLHERHHIHCGHNAAKLLAYLALCLHWFNPLVWLAFSLASADMEMSCDEAVIRALGDDIRADYSQLLLSMATESKILVRLPKTSERS